MEQQYNEIEQKQLDRLTAAGITLNDVFVAKYLAQPDDLGEFAEGVEIPDGFKKCGGCKHILKLYMFNVNNSAKNRCTGNCKACQKASANKSYNKTKGSRNYKEYYANNKEKKQAHGRAYYEKNKQAILDKQKDYHTSKQGKKVMHRAHKKRRELMEQNKGIPYKREWVIDRDKAGGDLPICIVCNETIKSERDLHLDHAIPVVMGGRDCFTNVACTHQLCNLRRPKDARDLSVEVVETLIAVAERYIDEHPELFEL